MKIRKKSKKDLDEDEKNKKLEWHIKSKIIGFLRDQQSGTNEDIKDFILLSKSNEQEEYETEINEAQIEFALKNLQFKYVIAFAENA